ncbi:hypothetical protein TsFJ059_000834 [Trichoderma semiorbis]|uniref:LysM domain-containing protein n=1 Tax=Trichoderma semiorbis TaxID=1491008 RepID=A0A9P8I233_9HYPO|nr:hypothetical protein TsFJ059_000834 [Trichoderma semiorbis]
MPLWVYYLLWSVLLQPLVYCLILSRNAWYGVSGNVDITAACNATFYERVGCSLSLYMIAMGQTFTSPQLLSEICTRTCWSDLMALNEKQRSVCDSSDFLGTEDYKLPPTYVSDLLLYTFHYSCVRDPATKIFCSPYFFKWNTKENATSAELCSDCNLLVQQAHLAFPIGYDDELASAHSSLASSCGVAKYPITSQPPYTLNEATTATITAPPNNPTQTNSISASSSSKLRPGAGYKKGPGFHMDKPVPQRIPNKVTNKVTNAHATVVRIPYTPKPLPLAPGTADSCKSYEHYRGPIYYLRGKNVNECLWLASAYRVDIDELISWNPSLSFDEANPSACAISQGYRYCVSRPEKTAGNSSNITTTSSTKQNPSEPARITQSPGDESDMQKKLESL